MRLGILKAIMARQAAAGESRGRAGRTCALPSQAPEAGYLKNEIAFAEIRLLFA